MMKLIITLNILIFLFLTSCSMANPSQLTPTFLTDQDTPMTQLLSRTITPSITSPLVTDMISTINLVDLIVLRRWKMTGIDISSANPRLWLSDSREFIMATPEGLALFNAYDSTSKILIPDFTTFSRDIDQNDLIYFYKIDGVHKINSINFNESILISSKLCGLNDPFLTAENIRSVDQSDSLITSHWSWGDIFNSYGKSLILLWDLTNKTCQPLIGPFTGWVQSLTSSPDGRYISYNVTVSKPDPTYGLFPDSSIHIYDLFQHKEVCNFPGRLSAFDSNNSLIIVGTPNQEKLSVVSIQNCKSEIQFNIDIEGENIAIHPNGIILAGASGRKLVFWDKTNGQIIHEITFPRSLVSYPISFSPDGKFLLISQDRDAPEDSMYLILLGIPIK